MTSPGMAGPDMDWPAEVARLNRIIQALMDRAERSTMAQGSDFSRFQSTIMLQEQVRRRTAELEKALSENEAVTRTLRAAEARFSRLVSQSLVGISMVEDGRISYANEKFNSIFGYEAGELLGLEGRRLAVAADRALLDAQVRRRLDGNASSAHYQFRGLHRDGSVLDIECHGNVMEVDGTPVLVSMILDVTERVQAERRVQALQEQLREQSIRDPLTGLYNRRYLDDFLQRELQLAKRSGHSVSVIMGDLDHFKDINDRYGHQVGDETLRAFAEILGRHSRSTDVSCRYGGEEFMLVLPGMELGCASDRAEALRRAIADTPLGAGATRPTLTASFGVASFPRDGATVAELVRAADRALYEAKNGGRDRVVTAHASGHPGVLGRVFSRTGPA
jgi:diguanylate cyclase (GGDEF)-like protein/PAS domain S-box-containing protein